MSIRRRLAVYAAAVVVASGVVALAVQGPAQAHGAPLVPGSRTWLCYLDGLTPQGNIVPKNPACAAAVAQSGTNSLYNWFGVLRSDANGRTVGFIPDGNLCSGANPGYLGFDLARTDWPVTHLTAGAQIQIRYNNWAHHPGTFYAYVTKDSWSPTRPLAWSDLEEQPFSVVTNPPSIGGPGSIDGYYYWNATLPANKSGRHIIYMRWVRSDSQENFFSCSDVVFDGGNGEVTGIGEVGNPPDPGQGNGACNVSIAITNSWPGGFQGEATVRAAPSAITGWVVTVTSPAGQSITQVWNGNLIANSGGTAQVRNADWNGSIPANGSTTFGFLGSASGTPSAPTATCSSI
ncbi:MAG: lytic polysaccharide monooxygenase [Micromonosporaceae bacterium]|nr:lytic polysaccharide monooxygenase [Micromonosporaceae bacterium]